MCDDIPFSLSSLSVFSHHSTGVSTGTKQLFLGGHRVAGVSVTHEVMGRWGGDGEVRVVVGIYRKDVPEGWNDCRGGRGVWGHMVVIGRGGKTGEDWGYV